MRDSERLSEDLGYVRATLARSDAGREPVGVWYLWAAVSVIGFALVDFAPGIAGIFWAAAGPLGFAVSAWLGWRGARSTGQFSSRDAQRHILHWAALLGAIALLVPLAVRGDIEGRVLGQLILVMLALAYALAAVHHHRGLAWVSLALAAGYGDTFLVDRFVWTGIGLLAAVALVVTGNALRRDGASR